MPDDGVAAGDWSGAGRNERATGRLGALTKELLVATFRAMRSVGLKTLNSKLSEYVRIAAAGETVLVTNRDRVVAELGPPRPDRSPRLADAEFAEMVREGILTPRAIEPGSRPLPKPKPVMTFEEGMKLLDETRSDRL